MGARCRLAASVQQQCKAALRLKFVTLPGVRQPDRLIKVEHSVGAAYQPSSHPKMVDPTPGI